MSCRHAGCDVDLVLRDACLKVSAVFFDGFPSLYCCTPVDQTSHSVIARKYYLSQLVGAGVLTDENDIAAFGFNCVISRKAT